MFFNDKEGDYFFCNLCDKSTFKNSRFFGVSFNNKNFCADCYPKALNIWNLEQGLKHD